MTEFYILYQLIKIYVSLNYFYLLSCFTFRNWYAPLADSLIILLVTLCSPFRCFAANPFFIPSLVVLNLQPERGQKKTVVVEEELTDEELDLAGVAGGCRTETFSGVRLSLPAGLSAGLVGVCFAVFLTGSSGRSMRVVNWSPTRSLITSSGKVRP